MKFKIDKDTPGSTQEVIGYDELLEKADIIPLGSIPCLVRRSETSKYGYLVIWNLDIC